jgi:hypothetical protein
MGNGPAESLGRTCRIAPNLVHRRIAEHQRYAVDGDACMHHHQNGGDVVKAHIRIDPDTHDDLPESLEESCAFDRQVEGNRGAE